MKHPGTYIPFEQAEVPLLMAAMRFGRPQDEEELPGFIPPGFCRGGDIIKSKRNGWITMSLPTTNDYGDPDAYASAKVWTGYYNYKRIVGESVTHTLYLTFPQGVIDEQRVLLCVINRHLQAHRANFYSGNDCSMPALQLLEAGIEWVTSAAQQYFERQWLSGLEQGRVQ